MGLAQKRILQELQKVNFPEWKKQIVEAAGFDVPLEIKWETVEKEDREDLKFYVECMNKVYFMPLVTVMKNICQDEMGKEALKASLKKIVINAEKGSNPDASKFIDGVLHINHEIFTNVDQDKTKVWTKMLEKAL